MTTFPDREFCIEPANVSHVYCVTSVNLANFPRPVVVPPEGVAATGLYRPQVACPPNYAATQTRGMTGDIRLKEGFNCAIRQSDGTFTIYGEVGAGACVLEEYAQEVPQDAEEERLLAEGKYLTGGPSCASILKYVNGISQPNIPIAVHGGLRAQVTPGRLTLTIQADPANLKDSCQIEEEC